MSLGVAIPDTFSGPLDLLLHLIRRDEMDIHDIPISRLTGAYAAEMEKLEIVDVDEATEFLDLASRLWEIKARMLAPADGEGGDEGEEDDDFDPRAGLVEALLEYRRFKEAARLLGGLAEEQENRYPRVAPRIDFSPSGEEADAAGVMDLLAAFQAMLLRLVPAGGSGEIAYTEKPVSVRIEQIEAVLAGLGRTRFSLLLSDAPTRREMVGFFIAILEMVRRGRIVARQGASFSDIVLERAEPRSGRVRAAASGAGGRVRRVPAAPPLFPPLRLRPDAGLAPFRRVPVFPPAPPAGGGCAEPRPVAGRAAACFRIGAC